MDELSPGNNVKVPYGVMYTIVPHPGTTLHAMILGIRADNDSKERNLDEG
ncbi:MAG: hypothetical protein ACRDT0_07760 [Pseudonocardiaceae bacterium]